MNKQRQTQIEIAASDYYDLFPYYSPEHDFIHGAQWADEHPNIKWHDLTKDPKDLPEDNREVIVKYISYIGNNECNDVASYVFNQEEQCYEWRFNILGSNQNILAWIEIPEFK